MAGWAPAQAPSGPAPAAGGADTGRGGGLLRPQRNAHRELLDTSGLWRLQLDPREEGGAAVAGLWDALAVSSIVLERQTRERAGAEVAGPNNLLLTDRSVHRRLKRTERPYGAFCPL